ncbi:MAG: hypothetical protein WCI91_03820 [Candidatus Nomurabacteria bacterium]
MKTLGTMVGGSLKNMTGAINLESTEYFKIEDFFKSKLIKNQDGIFEHLNNHFCIQGDAFRGEVMNSPKLILANYEIISCINERTIFEELFHYKIYTKFTMAHVMQICKIHIMEGAKILQENGQANLFFLDKSYTINLYKRLGKYWCVRVVPISYFNVWGAEDRLFALNNQFNPPQLL